MYLGFYGFFVDLFKAEIHLLDLFLVKLPGRTAKIGERYTLVHGLRDFRPAWQEVNGRAW